MRSVSDWLIFSFSKISFFSKETFFTINPDPIFVRLYEVLQFHSQRQICYNLVMKNLQSEKRQSQS